MQVKRISRSTRPVLKDNSNLKIGDEVLSPHGKKRIKNIFPQGLRSVYQIKLSDGRAFRTDADHLNTVSYRKNLEGKPVWENIPTSWIISNIDNYVFRFPTDDDIFSFSKEDIERVSTPTNSIDLKDYVLNNEDGLYIQSVDKVEKEHTRCISLDYDLGLYYTGNKIITHNSFTSSLSSLYVASCIWAMRDHKKFFGLSQASSTVVALISFTMDKAAQLLLQPFMQVLLSSKKFHRVKQEERLAVKQKENPDLICWTTAGRMGQIQLYGDYHFMIASSPAQLLGLNMLSSIMSEMSFFIDRGFSPEYIWRIYQDSKARVRSRFEGKYYSNTILDSSPNDMEESPIDNFVFSGRAQEDPTNYVVTGPQWKFLPHKMEKWYKTGETFPVFRGNSNQAPAIIQSDAQRTNYNEDEIIDVPIDLKGLFQENLLKNIKDYAGWPAGTQGKLFRDLDVINGMFSVQLRNIYSYIKAPDTQQSKGLIWNIIKPQFFIQHSKGVYEFYRAPNEKRYIHIDQSETNDQTGISCVHPEIDKHGDIVYITDFTIVIDPGKGRINLNAIPEFILDIRDKGKMKIDLVTFDQYQSSSAIQFLKEKGFNVSKTSVDISVKPYYSYMQLINTQKIQAGRNIFLKNNLRSLQEIKMDSGKKKIDHEKGDLIKDDGGDWEQSMMGKNAKDASDSHCGAVWNAVHNFKGIPMYRWEYDKEMNELFEDNKLPKKNAQIEIAKRKIEKKIQEQYSLKISS